MLKYAATFFCLWATISHAAEEKAGTVTIPVSEYIQLRDAKQAPELTTVESVTFDGTFGKSLTMTVSGSASGAPKAVDILERNDVFGVKDCAGSNAMLSGDGSRLNVVPLRADRFKITCQIFVRNWAQVEFTVDNALYAGARLTGGEALVRVSGTSHVITLVRPSAPTEDSKAPLAVTARYRVSVQPEESRFQYEFQINNPNRTLRKMKITKANGEIFSQIRTTIQHQEATDGLNLELQPGENVIRTEGRFSGNSFVPPVEGQAFLLVENSPTLQLTVESVSRRVSPKDAGISPRYSGARAYLIANDQKVSWEARKLEVFAALGYSVNNANYLYYVPRRGTPIVEANFEINNQGMPEVALDVPGQVTYLEVGGQPQVLSRDKDGKLLLQLPSGVQNVLVQYLSKTEQGSLLAMPREDLARPAAVLSNVSLNLSLDPRWSLPFGRSLFEIKSDLSLSDFIWAALLALFVGWLIREIGLGRRDRIVFPLAVFVAAVSAPFLFPWILLAGLLYLGIRQRAEIRTQWPKGKVASLFSAVVLGIAALILFMKLQGTSPDQEASRFASEQLYNKMDAIGGMSDARGGSGGGGGRMAKGRGDQAAALSEAPPPPGSLNQSMELDQQEPAPAGGDYQGIPARLAIPEGRSVLFNQGIIDAKTPVRIGALLINRGAGAVVMILALLAMLHIIYYNRRRFKEGARL